MERVSEPSQRFSSDRRAAQTGAGGADEGQQTTGRPRPSTPPTSPQVEAELAAIFGEDELLRHPPDPFEEKILTGRNSFTDLRDQLAQESDGPASPAPSAPPTRPRLSRPSAEPAETARPSGAAAASSRPSDPQSRIAELRRDLDARSAARQAAASAASSSSRFFREEPGATTTGRPGSGRTVPPSAGERPARPTGSGTAPRPSTERPTPPRPAASGASRPSSTDDRIAALRRDLANRRSQTGAAPTPAEPAPAVPPARPAREPLATDRPRTPRPAGESHPTREPHPAEPLTRRRPGSPAPAEPEATPQTGRPHPSGSGVRPAESAGPRQEDHRRQPAPAEAPAAPAVDLIDESLFVPPQESPAAAEGSARPAPAEETTPPRPSGRRHGQAKPAPEAETPVAAPVAEPAPSRPQPRPSARPPAPAPAGKPRQQPAREQGPAFAPASSDVAVAQQVTKVYGRGASQVEALRGVDLSCAPGLLTAVAGPSGSGKTVLLHCLAGLESPTSGTISVGGQSVERMDAKQLAAYRRDSIGLIFRSGSLVEGLTVEENIRLPFDIRKETVDSSWYDQVMKVLRLADLASKKPGDLSVGAQQRVACARAVLAKPVLIVADEPTGDLDTVAAADLLVLLRTCVSQLGQTVLLATHDPQVAAVADRVVLLGDGRVVDRLDSPGADQLSAAWSSLGRSGS